MASGKGVLVTEEIEDAIYAVKAALKEGIVSGAGVAFYNAADYIKANSIGEKILLQSIKSPFYTILQNGGIDAPEKIGKGKGIDVTSGKYVNMIKSGIIDPVLVTKTALKNAVSVVNTIFSADCVINNVRDYEGN